MSVGRRIDVRLRGYACSSVPESEPLSVSAMDIPACELVRASLCSTDHCLIVVGGPRNDSVLGELFSQFWLQRLSLTYHTDL